MIDDPQVSMEQAKRDISELVNRVAAGGERIVLTSRGRPKAALVNMEDYERLTQMRKSGDMHEWEQWVADNERLSQEILARRGGVPIDVGAVFQPHESYGS